MDGIVCKDLRWLQQALWGIGGPGLGSQEGLASRVDLPGMEEEKACPYGICEGRGVKEHGIFRGLCTAQLGCC